MKDVPVVGFSFGGWIAAEMATKDAGFISKLVLVSPFLLTPEKGAETLIWLASNDVGTGKYFFKKSEIRAPPQAYDRNLQKTDFALGNWMMSSFTWKKY